MNNPLVSVLMTAYNRESFLEEAMRSVLASSYRNFELIVVDDASSDRTFEVARAVAATDDRVRVYRNEVNLGDYPNRNLAASYARGEYLKYVDADDLIYPHGLEVMVTAMELFPDASLGMQCNVRENHCPYPFKVTSHEAYVRQFLGSGFFQSGPTGTIMRRKFFECLGGFSPIRHAGDIDLWLRISKTSPVVLFQPALIWWRQHDGQEHSKGRGPGNIRLHVYHEVYQKTLSDEHLPLTSKELDLALLRYKRFRTKSVVKMILRLKLCEAISMMKATDVTLTDIMNPRHYMRNI